MGCQTSRSIPEGLLPNRAHLLYLSEGADQALAAMLRTAPSTLHVVTDFDHTLTCPAASQCHDLLDNETHLPVEFCTDVRQMLDFSCPNPVTAGKPFEFWWEYIHNRMIQTQVHRDQLNTMIQQSAPSVTLRPGAKEALLEMSRLGIPVTIVSAGITPIIQEVLEQAGLATPNVFVCANQPIFDDTHGLASHWHPPNPVHSRNKYDVRYVFGEHFIGAGCEANRTNVLILGDSLGDVHAAGEMCPHSTRSISVGFYDTERVWKQPQEKFEEVYDVLLEGKNGDLQWLAHALTKH